MPPSLRALLILLAWALLLLLGTPGLDGIPANALRDERTRARYLGRMPSWTLPVAEAVVRFNRELRLPLVRAVEPIQRPLRVNQSWNLYLDGADRCEGLEILLDGELRFRSNDPDHRWRAEVLKSPSLRAIVGGTASHPRGGGNWQGLTRVVTRMAREDFPGTAEVVLRALSGPWDACATKEVRRIVAAAPDWEPRRP